MRVRYRVDGALQEVMKPPNKLRAALTSPVKIMAQLNIPEPPLPHDCRTKLKFAPLVTACLTAPVPAPVGLDAVCPALEQVGGPAGMDVRA